MELVIFGVVLVMLIKSPFFRFQAGRRRYTVHFNSMVQVSDCTTFAILLSPIVP